MMTNTQLIKFIFIGRVSSGKTTALATISEDDHFIAEIDGMRCLIPAILAESLRQYYLEALPSSNYGAVSPNG